MGLPNNPKKSEFERMFASKANINGFFLFGVLSKEIAVGEQNSIFLYNNHLCTY